MNRVTVSFLFEEEPGDTGGLQEAVQKTITQEYLYWDRLFKNCGLTLVNFVTESKEEIKESLDWTKEKWESECPAITCPVPEEVKNSGVN
jgi:hypothetical protein